jgi:hypothetical protein
MLVVALERTLAAAAPALPENLIGVDVRVMQIGWALLILASPVLYWRGGSCVGVGGRSTLIAVALSVALALAATWQRGDEPLHANGHAWREAREVLAPWGVRANGLSPFMHGKGSIALQWLLADVEQSLTGTANPLRISRAAAAAAAGATAFLVIVLARSPWAGLAAGCVFAFMPLGQTLAVSGSVLVIPAWLLPLSLALLIAAAGSGDRVLLLGAALAAALGTLSHTAMLAWPPALVAAWLVIARRDIRFSPAALPAISLVALAWALQAANCYEMISGRNEDSGLLEAAQHALLERDLFIDPRWVSPALPAMLALWVVGSLVRRQLATLAASMLALAIVALPFFAVATCSSDAVRYQGALLGLVTSLAVAGLWQIPLSHWIGGTGAALLRTALLATLVVLPLASNQPPTDPVAVEHKLVEEAVRRMQPGTLIVLPQGRLDQNRIIPDFPDFLLPDGSRVTFEGDPRIELHKGPRLNYVGLACISWNEDVGPESSALRPECRGLLKNAHPWAVRSLELDDLPRGRNGDVWAFHRLATGVPFGFFAPD